MGPFLLHHERIAGAAPRRWMLMLHGIYGSGANWRTIARALVTRRPDMGVILVDLRMHGRSQGAPPPHTLAAAAADIAGLVAHLAAAAVPVCTVCGHSFGGKVALRYRAMAGPALERTFMLDASPSARPGAMDEPDNTVVQVLRALQAMPPTFPDRRAFTAALAERGVLPALGPWLAMNLEPHSEGYTLRLKLPAIAALLADYYAWDGWSAVSGGAGALHVIAATRSSALSGDDMARFAAAAERSPDRVFVSALDASHWLHIDASEALLDRLIAALPESE